MAQAIATGPSTLPGWLNFWSSSTSIGMSAGNFKLKLPSIMIHDRAQQMPLAHGIGPWACQWPGQRSASGQANASSPLHPWAQPGPGV